MTLKTKMNYLMVVIGASMLLAIAGILYFINKQSHKLETTLQIKNVEVELERINGLVYAIVMDSRGIYMSPTVAAAKPFAAGMKSSLDALEASVASLVMGAENLNVASIAKVASDAKAFVAFRTELMRLGVEVNPEKAREVGDNAQNRANRTSLNTSLVALSKNIRELATQDVVLITELQHQIRIASLVTLIIPIILTILCLILIRANLTSPITMLQKEILTLARGDRQRKIWGTMRKDEIGDIAKSLETLRNELSSAEQERSENDRQRRALEEHKSELEALTIEKERKIVADLFGAGLAHLAAKDLTYALHGDVPAAYSQLKANYNSAIENVNGAVRKVRENAFDIRSETVQIAKATDEISRKSEQQAASLEAATTAIQDLSRTLATTAAEASATQQYVMSARAESDTSRGIVAEAMTAMEFIADSSKKVNEIATVMDGIAFQTNLLALNAGVEAARAGESGKGFAVVASEVRALALRATDSAREIDGLLKQSSDQVQNGVRLVSEVNNAISNVMDKVSSISEFIKALAASSKQQSDDLGNISVNISHIDQSMQMTAAMLEETASSTRNLLQSADSLSALVDEFKLSGRDKRSHSEFNSLVA